MLPDAISRLSGRHQKHDVSALQRQTHLLRRGVPGRLTNLRARHLRGASAIAHNHAQSCTPRREARHQARPNRTARARHRDQRHLI